MTKREKILERALEMAVQKVVQTSGDVCPFRVCHSDVCEDVGCVVWGMKYFIRKATKEAK